MDSSMGFAASLVDWWFMKIDFGSQFGIYGDLVCGISFANMNLFFKKERPMGKYSAPSREEHKE